MAQIFQTWVLELWGLIWGILRGNTYGTVTGGRLAPPAVSLLRKCYFFWAGGRTGVRASLKCPQFAPSPCANPYIQR